MRAPIVWQALADAAISPRQATAILGALQNLPPDLAPGQETAAQQTMVDHAGRLDPSELAVVGNRLIEVIDPDHADILLERRLEQEEQRARRNRELHLHPDGMGSTLIKGRIPTAEGEKLTALLDSVVEKNQTDEPPPCGSFCPGPSCGLCGGRPSRAMRRADALMEVTQAYADANHSAARGSDRARINVTVDLDTLRRGIGCTETTAGPMSAQQLRLLACDAEIIPMVLGGFGVPLDVGQLHRFFDGELRAALVARDAGCIFPGCDQPARRCDAHHIRPFWWGGPTSLDNGVLLCPPPPRPGRTLAYPTPQQEPLGSTDQPRRSVTGIPATTRTGPKPPTPTPPAASPLAAPHRGRGSLTGSSRHVAARPTR
ncbi:HNH endonuclease signature motif containing protein [Enemella evansiae]|uniref:HNH endonuclease signature motif containing protein n=1 Tax=Enemella evansiae TaxID=2016499 RepID=UPI0015C5A22E|nr:HNH endonuclease signature motif containing protein [Enemella evansiae]